MIVKVTRKGPPNFHECTCLKRDTSPLGYLGSVWKWCTLCKYINTSFCKKYPISIRLNYTCDSWEYHDR